MYGSIYFPFRLTKEVNMGYNTVTGESADAFMEIKLNRSKVDWDPAKYAEMHATLRADVAQQLKCQIEYVIPITGTAYEAEVDVNEEPARCTHCDHDDCDE